MEARELDFFSGLDRKNLRRVHWRLYWNRVGSADDEGMRLTRLENARTHDLRHVPCWILHREARG
jgi:hypothetical protein